MKISATPNLCVLHFDIEIGDTPYKASLEQKIGKSDQSILHLFDVNGTEILEESIISLIKSYLKQMYSISYDNTIQYTEDSQHINGDQEKVKLDPPI